MNPIFLGVVTISETIKNLKELSCLRIIEDSAGTWDGNQFQKSILECIVVDNREPLVNVTISCASKSSNVINALEDLKGVDLKVLDVRAQTTITDVMVIVSGTSTRHVKALADNVTLKAKADGYSPLGVEGEQGAEWVLIDLGDVVVHVMMPAVREFYALEKLWSVGDHNNASA